MISIRNLTLRVPQRVLIKDLSLEIEAGQRWCVLGKNGSGKSTFLKTIAGLRDLVEGATGDIWWNGQSLSQISKLDLARLRAYAEQIPQADHDWKAEMIVEAGAWPWRLMRQTVSSAPQEELKDLVLQAMKRCDIEHLIGHPWRFLSGGERQRIALASCLVQSTAVLILDEPTAHLDLGHQFSVMDDLVKASQSCNQSIVASVHDLQLALRCFTHALILNGDSQGSWIAGEVANVLLPKQIEYALGHPVAWAATVSGTKVLVPQ